MTAPVQVGPSPTSGGPAPLTPNELAALQYAASGMTRPRIAEQLRYSEPGVDKLMARVLDKLGAANAPHAVLLACRAGLLDGRPQRHGDHAGYVAHARRGEDPCDACDAGERAYRADLRANRKRVAVDAA